MTTAITNKIANDRDVVVWVVPESTAGTVAYPDNSHIVGAFEPSYPEQKPEYTNSKERTQSRDVIDRCSGQMPGGEWGFSTYCRPGGAGVAPQEDALVKGLLGVKTLTPATDVVYSQQVDKGSYSIWFLVDHTMICCVGATIGKVEANLQECQFTWQWSGGFMKMLFMGTEVISSNAASGQAVVEVANTDKYSVGGSIALADSTGTVTDDNTGAGYVILSIQPDTSITLSTNLAVGESSGGFVAPFNPGGSLSGSVLASRTAEVTIGSIVKPVVDFTIEYMDEPEYLQRERSTAGFPVSYAEKQREIKGSAVLVFRRDDADYFNLGYEDTEAVIKVVIGETVGYQLQFDFPRAKYEVPTLEDSEPVVELTLEFMVLGTNGEDSATFTYK